MKYLVIAEKPSVSKSIAKVIGAYRQEDGYLEGGDCVVAGVWGIWQSMQPRNTMMNAMKLAF